MKRQIIHIDEEKCSGCGACAGACHEGAIAMVNGKAKLMREDYCDGMGDCLPGCPTGAITFETREAPAYDAEDVRRAKEHREASSGCPGSRAAVVRPQASPAAAAPTPSQLRQWPVQIKLVPVSAPWFDGADLLLAADCTAYACGSFHSDFIRGRITLIGCPKLDSIDYSEKLSAILRANDIRSVTLTRMTVPCCGGLVFALRQALEKSGRTIPCRVVTIAPDGRVVSEETL